MKRTRLFALLLALALCLVQTAAFAEADADPLTGIPYDTDTEYKYMYSAEITTMNYLTTSVSNNQKSLANFIDSLIEYDCYGNIVPCLAESWSCSDDGLEWTFKLRQDAKWYTCDGDEVAPVTANDFVYALKLICDPVFDSDMTDMVTSYIKNASELYAGSLADANDLGVRAEDDYTLVYTLRQPCAYFLTLLTYGCYLPVYGEFYESLAIENPEPVINDDGTEGDPVINEFGTDRDKILYCGGYLCSSWEPQEQYVWVKNENYWDAEHIYITKINGKFNAEAGSIAPEMYLRGELDECTVSTDILDDWLNGDNAQYVHATRPGATAMWMLFNFNPHFDDTAASDNYKIAVNNKNFRLSIATGLDKKYSVSAYDPYNAESLILNTVIPEGFCSYEGKDYSEFGNLPAYKDGMYDADQALAYRDAARAELEAAGATFPIEIPIYYNPATANQDHCCQLIEKQLEELLGSDYIDITVYGGPSTNYIGEVRRPGLWGLFEAGWGPDYADPATYFEPYGYGWTYGSQEYIEGDEYKTGYVYTQEDFDKAIIDDQDLVGAPQFVFNSLVEAGRAETQDLAARYELFAKAEEYMLTEALTMPFRVSSNGYVASNLSVFDGEYAKAGICEYRYKGRHLLTKSYSMDEYAAAQAAWEAAKANQE